MSWDRPTEETCPTSISGAQIDNPKVIQSYVKFRKRSGSHREQKERECGDSIQCVTIGSPPVGSLFLRLNSSTVVTLQEWV